MYNFQQLSEPSVKVVIFAQEEARRLGHNYVGAEQLLIGLLSTDNRARQLLNDLQIDLQAAKAEIEKISGRGSGFIAVEMPFTPQARKAFDIATNLARSCAANVQPEHLLIGILDSGESVVLRILENLGTSVFQLREAAFAQFSFNNQVEAEPMKEFNPGDTVFVVARNIKVSATWEAKNISEQYRLLLQKEAYTTLPFCVCKTKVVRKTLEENNKTHSYHVLLWEYGTVSVGGRTEIQQVLTSDVYSSQEQAIAKVRELYQSLVELGTQTRVISV